MSETRVLHVEGITGCHQCPARWTCNNGFNYCAMKYDKLIYGKPAIVVAGFPDWCPLPKQEEE